MNCIPAIQLCNIKENRVRNHVLKYLYPQSDILELNSGTGEDAIFFAKLGHHINATDISQGMQNIVKQKVENNNLQNNISTELCSFTELEKLQNKGPYDLIFSNFAGLNCTDKLPQVLSSFHLLTKITRHCNFGNFAKILFVGEFINAERKI